MEVKKQVFQNLNTICKSTCLFASNTSSLDIDMMMGGQCFHSTNATNRKNYLLGLHFFTPAHIMKLVEIVQCANTSKLVIETAFTVIKKLGKVGVLVSKQPILYILSNVFNCIV